MLSSVTTTSRIDAVQRMIVPRVTIGSTGADVLDGSYCGSPPRPETLAGHWNFDPALLLMLLVGLTAAAMLPSGRRGHGLAAVGVLAVTFVSPLCSLTVALFSARALHHLVLVGGAAALLARAWPGRVGPGMAMALAVSTLVLWAWHLPALYDAALANTGVYWAMQATLLAGGWLFWRAVLSSSPPAAAMGIAGGAAQMGMLGAILSFAPTPLYVSHLATTAPFGIAPLVDQQLAGLMMWVVGLLPYAVAAAWLGRGGWRRMAAVGARA